MVITGREHGRQERVPDRKEHRADDRIDRPVEHHPPRARDEPEREGLHEDRRDRRDGDRDLRNVGDEHGTQERAHGGENERRGDGGGDVAKADAGQEPRRDNEREHANDERGDATTHDAPRSTSPSRKEMELGRVEADHARITLGR